MSQYSVIDGSQSSKQYAASDFDAGSCDFDCALCLRLFYEPLSFSCGHSFCRSCIRQALKLKQSCPVCRAPVLSSAADASVNVSMMNFIKRHFPSEYAARTEEARADALAEAAVAKKKLTLGEDAVFLPDGSVEMPLFQDRNSIVFPGQPVTVFIYEPQYVIMVTRCLSGSRRFVMLRSPETGSMGTVVQIDDARVLGGGQYLLQVHGIGRCTINGPIIIEAEAHGLRSARVLAVDDTDDIIDIATNEAMISNETRLLVDEASRVLEGYFASLNDQMMHIIRRRFGDPPRRVERPSGECLTLEYYKKLSFWLPCALSLRSHGGDAQKMSLFSCTSMNQRLEATCRIVVDSDANPVVAKSQRRLTRGRKGLLDIGFARHIRTISRVGSSCFLLLVIFAGLVSWTFFKRQEARNFVQENLL